MKLIANIRGAAARRIAYNRTVRALSNLPLDLALDLGIYTGDARKIARQAVYGA